MQRNTARATTRMVSNLVYNEKSLSTNQNLGFNVQFGGIGPLSGHGGGVGELSLLPFLAVDSPVCGSSKTPPPFGSLGFEGLLSSLDSGSFGLCVTGAQLPLASNAVFSGHVCVDGGGATPEGGDAIVLVSSLPLLKILHFSNSPVSVLTSHHSQYRSLLFVSVQQQVAIFDSPCGPWFTQPLSLQKPYCGLSKHNEGPRAEDNWTNIVDSEL
jgi:hypothetical protein